MALEKVTLIIPVTELGVPYADFIVGSDAGFFKEEGLEVEIQLLPNLTDGIKMVSTQRAHFNFVAPDVVMTGRAQGLPVVTVFGQVQKYQFGFATLKSSNITGIKELKGKKIGLPVPGVDIIAIPILTAAGLENKDYTFEVPGFDARFPVLTRGLIDAAFTWDTEIVIWHTKGVSLNWLPGSDFLPYMGNGITTSEKLITERPDLIKKFLRALAKSMVFVKANPDITLQIIGRAKPEITSGKKKEELLNVLNAAILRENSPQTEKDGLGWIRKDAWELQQKNLFELKKLKAITDVNKMITNDFIKDANNFDKQKVINQAKEFILK